MRKVFLWIIVFAWAYLIFHLTSIPNFKVADNSLVSLIISSGGHFFFFGIQAVLLYFALPGQTVTAITATSLYGLLDELHQINIPGRSADPIDWALDTLGAIIFLAIIKKYLKA
jgi:hypothetical protein